MTLPNYSMKSLIEHYLTEIEPVVDPLEQDDRLGRRAVIAFGRMVDGDATLADLDAYRAWITWLRLNGLDEDALRSATDMLDEQTLRLIRA